MNIKQPQQGKYPYSFQRWLNIFVRTAHIGAVGVVLGGTVLHHDSSKDFLLWHHMMIVTGIVLLILEWLNAKGWLHRGMAIVVYFHVGLVVLVFLLPDFKIAFLWAVLISGAIGSHMPKRFRHWSILYGPEKDLNRY